MNNDNTQRYDLVMLLLGFIETELDTALEALSNVDYSDAAKYEPSGPAARIIKSRAEATTALRHCKDVRKILEATRPLEKV